ncbi:helix-turn-helix domain-containing protein [Actinomadura harenae]|uniref:Helix-turn-helix domain-containing protein n=1 Tax=Actinomadura harenae TaxID=2483351 RepID=A0A3M2M818_9ACTN|nr:helix-turn-helix transcriptional regulator [Actinomadura harenae]RMI44705.1 helix-turn-helix domain-containing protein [Actinomadura harenae]
MPARDNLDPMGSLWDVIALEVRAWRIAKHMSEVQVAALLKCDRSTVSRIENGLRKLNDAYANSLDEAWKTSGLFAALVFHASTFAEQDWRTGLRQYEREASRMRMWDVSLVPGLLQHPEYARAVIAKAYEAGLIKSIDQALEDRLERQRAVFERDDPPQISAVINWPILRHTYGGSAVMRAQIELLMEHAGRPNVSLRFVESDAMGHVGLDGSFKLLTVKNREYAFCEAPHEGRILYVPADVHKISVRWEQVSDHASPVRRTGAVLQEAMEIYR